MRGKTRCYRAVSSLLCSRLHVPRPATFLDRKPAIGVPRETGLHRPQTAMRLQIGCRRRGAAPLRICAVIHGDVVGGRPCKDSRRRRRGPALQVPLVARTSVRGPGRTSCGRTGSCPMDVGRPVATAARRGPAAVDSTNGSRADERSTLQYCPQNANQSSPL